MSDGLRELSNYEKFLKFRLDAHFSLPSDKKFVWFQPNPKEETFVNAEVVSGELDDMKIKIKNPESGSTEEHKNGVQVFPRNPVKFDGVEDMAELSYLNEPSVLHNLRTRYNSDLIHTYSGLFCVIINPYKWITIYTQEIVEMYQGKRRNEMAPHVFAVADGAYRALVTDRQNQSMLITGESGAGKTENTKKVIQYLALVAGRSGGGGELEQQIIQANPILESFGNAKTLRNNNSSRFGKFIEIQFNDGGLISGATISSYLLEKSRVVWQAQGERTFHIFYQLTKSATDDERATWNIQQPQGNYGFLKGQSYDAAGIDDDEEYTATKDAMKIMNFNDEDIKNVLAVIAGISHLGNIEFSSGRGESSTVKDMNHVTLTASAFDTDAAGLAQGLVEPRIQAGGQMVKTSLNTRLAEASRDALAKAIYGRLFLWIIKKINEAIGKARRHAFIGVLDIAGFEIFEYNTFEQLCINYTNEKLQQFFNNHMFKLEQEEYIREKINWTFIDFGMDSQATIDLIEARSPPGVLALLDESCYTQSSDERFLQKMHNQFGKAHPKYGMPRFSKTAFEIVHYAGRVSYETEGWIEKNKDPLQLDLMTNMIESKNPFMAKLFTDRSLAVAGQSGSMASAGGKARAGKASRGANFITVGAHHKEGLGNLMKTLYSTSPHFIRCILPNARQVPGEIEDKIVLDQLRCNGVLEGIRISRKGFPNRIPYGEFVRRYYLMGDNVPRNAADARAATEAILSKLKPKDYSDGPAMKPETPYRFGLTKIFFRAGTLAWIEEQREKKIGELIIDIQAAARAWCHRRQWRGMREQTVAARIIQQNLRAYLDLKNWPWWKLYTKARPLLKRRNFEKEIEEREDIIKDLKAQLAERDATIKELESRLAEANSKIDDLTDKLQAEMDKKESLEDELDDLEKEKQELERQLKDLQEDLEDERAHAEAIEKEKAAVEERLAETEAALKEEKNEKAHLEGVKKTHERELEDAANKAKADADAIARLEDQKKKLEEEVEEIAHASKDVQSALEAARKKASGEIDALREDLEIAEKKIEDLTKTKADLEGDLQKLQDDLEAEQESVRNEKSEGSKLADELAATKRQLDSANESLEKVKNQYKALQKEREEIQEAANESDHLAEQLNRAKNKLQDDLDELSAQLDRESAERRAAEKRGNKLDAELKDLRQKLSESEQYGDEQYVQLKHSREENESLRQELEELEEKAAKLNKEKKAAEGDLQSLTEERDDLARKNKSLSSRITELGGALEDAEREAEEAAASAELSEALRKAQGQLAETKAHLEVAESNVRKLEEGKKTLKREFDELNEAYEDEQNARQAAERLKKKFESEMEELAERLDAEQKARAKAETARKKALSEVALARADQGGSLNEEDVRKYLDQIQELKDQLEGENEAKNALEKRRRAAEAEAEDLRAQLDDANDSRDRVAKQRRAIEMELEELKDSLEEAEEDRADLEEDKRRREIEAEDFKKKLELEIEARERLEAQKKDLEAELEDYRSGQDDASKNKAEVERRARRLEGEIDDLNMRLEAELKARQKLEQANKKLQRDYRDARSRLGEEETTRADSENSIWKLEEELDELRAKYDNAEKSRAVLEKTNKTLEQQLEEAREGLDDETRAKSRLEKQKRSLENELEELREQIDEAEEQVLEAEDSRKRVELELEDMRRIVERESEQRDQFEESARKAERELAEARDRLAEEEVGRTAAERSKRKLEQEVEDVTKQLDGETKVRSKIEKEKRALEAELKDLRDRGAVLERTQRGDSEQASKLSDEVKRLKTQIAEETEARAAAEGAKRRFELENRNFQEDIEKLEGEVKSLKAELEEVSAEKDQLNDKIKGLFS